MRAAMAVEQVTTSEEFRALKPGWDALWRADRKATPFQSPHWLLPWWDEFAGEATLAALVSRSGPSLTALAPLLAYDEGGMFIGAGISDYLDLLAVDQGAADELFASLEKAGCSEWYFDQLRPDAHALQAKLPSAWEEELEDLEACPVLSLEGADEEFESLLSTHARKKLRYATRSLQRERSMEFETVSSSTLGSCLEHLFALHAARWQKRDLPGVLADESVQRFHRAVAPRMLAAGALRMYLMRIDDRAAAVFYGFAHHGIIYYYLSGYDPQYEKHSIGNVIVAHALREAIREGCIAFDFLRGAEEYKYAWGARDRMNRRRHLTR